MELDEMKLMLNRRLEADIPTVNSADLETVLAGKTHSITRRIRQSIWFEWFACLLCSAVSLWAWLLYPMPYVRFFCAAVWFCTGIITYALFTLWKKVRFYETAPVSIRDRLQQMIAIVNRFIQLYFRISMALLPVIFIFGLITGYMDVWKKNQLQSFHWNSGLLLYISSFAVWSVLMYFFSRWYIKKLYGNYLLQLKLNLQDIENG